MTKEQPHSQSFSHFLERLVREDFQISASELRDWGLSDTQVTKLLMHRFALRTATLLSCTSLWFQSEGLRHLNLEGTKLFLIGFLLDRIGKQVSRLASNGAGAIVYSHLQEVLANIEPYLILLHDMFHQHELTQEQIGKMKSLPTTAYDAELTSASVQEKNALPLTASAWLGSHQLFLEAITVLGLWRYSAWSGRQANHESGVKRKARSNLAVTSRNFSHLRMLSKEHLKMVVKLGLRQEMRHVFFLASALLNPQLSSVFGRFQAINSGLAPTDWPLTATRAMDSAVETRQMARALFAARKCLIIHEDDWTEHRYSTTKQPKPNIDQIIFSGVILKGFRALLPSGKMLFDEPYDITLNAGQITTINARSGEGKTILFHEIAQVIKHPKAGQVFLVSPDETITSLLEKENLFEVRKIVFFPELFAKSQSSLGLVDILKPFFLIAESKFVASLQQQLAQEGVSETVVHDLIHGAIKQTAPVATQISPDVRTLVEEYKAKLLDWARHCVSTQGGNLSTLIDSVDERTLNTLSAGQTKRFLVLLADLAATYYPETKLILLDEPFHGLDKKVDNDHLVPNFMLQHLALEKILERRPDIAVFIAEHEHVAEEKNKIEMELKENALKQLTSILGQYRVRKKLLDSISVQFRPDTLRIGHEDQQTVKTLQTLLNLPDHEFSALCASFLYPEEPEYDVDTLSSLQVYSLFFRHSPGANPYGSVNATELKVKLQLSEPEHEAIVESALVRRGLLLS